MTRCEYAYGDMYEDKPPEEIIEALSEWYPELIRVSARELPVYERQDDDMHYDGYLFFGDFMFLFSFWSPIAMWRGTERLPDVPDHDWKAAVRRAMQPVKSVEQCI